MEQYHQAKSNRHALTATRARQYREIPWADMKAAIASRQGQRDSILTVATMALLQRAKRDKVPRKDLVYVIDHNNKQMRCGVLTGAIPSTVVDSGATSSVVTAGNKCHRTERASSKVFYPTRRTDSRGVGNGSVSFQGPRTSIRSAHHTQHIQQLADGQKQVCRYRIHHHF